MIVNKQGNIYMFVNVFVCVCVCVFEFEILYRNNNNYYKVKKNIRWIYSCIYYDRFEY